jgi:LPS export ABC transporter permease LptG
MHNISAPMAAEVVGRLRPLEFRHLLDIGGASGTWTMAFLGAVPEARATLFDLPDVVPMAQQRAREVKTQITLSTNLASDLRPRQWEVTGNNQLIVDEILARERGRLHRMVLASHERDRMSLIFAGSGDIFPTPDRTGTLVVDLYDAIRHDFELRDVETYRISSWDSLREKLPPPPHFKALLGPQAKVAATMRIDELWTEYGEAQAGLGEADRKAAELGRDRISEQVIAKARHVRSIVELNRRAALPMACLCFAILGVPLGLTQARSGKGAGFSISMLIIVVYYITFSFFEGQSVRQRFPAWLGPWMGNVILLPWIAWAYWKLRRPSGQQTGWINLLYGFAIRLTRRIRGRLSKHSSAPPEEIEEAVPEQALADLAGTTHRFIRRSDRYVGMKFLHVVGLALLAASTLFLLFEVKDALEETIKRQQPISLVFRYLGFILLERLPEILPLACLAGAAVTISLLSRTGELTAFKANGISLRRLALPVLTLAAGLSFLLFMFGNTLIPTATRKAQEVHDQIRGKPSATRGFPVTGNWTFGPKGERLYHYSYYDAQRDEFQALRVLTLDPTRSFLVDHRFSERARFREPGGWELEGGWYIRFAENGKWATGREAYDGSYTVELDSPETFAPIRKASLTSNKAEYARVLTLAEISERITDLTERGYDVTSLRVAWHGKFAGSVRPFVMVLLGLPFAFRGGRKGSLYGIGIALALAIVYWSVFSGFNALGLESALEPVLAVWAPNVLFGLLGAYLLLYVRT